MPEIITCPSCGAKLRIPQQFSGRRVKCPKCGQGISTEADVPTVETVEEEPEAGYRPQTPSRAREQDEDDRRRQRRRRNVDWDDFDDDEDDYDDEPRPRRRRRRRQLNWMDQQFTSTPLVLLIMFPICCGMFAIVFGILGVCLCQDPKARRNAIMVLAISAVWIVVATMIAVGNVVVHH